MRTVVLLAVAAAAFAGCGGRDAARDRAELERALRGTIAEVCGIGCRRSHVTSARCAGSGRDVEGLVYYECRLTYENGWTEVVCAALDPQDRREHVATEPVHCR